MKIIALSCTLLILSTSLQVSNSHACSRLFVWQFLSPSFKVPPELLVHFERSKLLARSIRSGEAEPGLEELLSAAQALKGTIRAYLQETAVRLPDPDNGRGDFFQISLPDQHQFETLFVAYKETKESRFNFRVAPRTRAIVEQLRHALYSTTFVEPDVDILFADFRTIMHALDLTSRGARRPEIDALDKWASETVIRINYLSLSDQIEFTITKGWIGPRRITMRRGRAPFHDEYSGGDTNVTEAIYGSSGILRTEERIWMPY